MQPVRTATRYRASPRGDSLGAINRLVNFAAMRGVCGSSRRSVAGRNIVRPNVRTANSIPLRW